MIHVAMNRLTNRTGSLCAHGEAVWINATDEKQRPRKDVVNHSGSPPPPYPLSDRQSGYVLVLPDTIFILEAHTRKKAVAYKVCIPCQLVS